MRGVASPVEHLSDVDFDSLFGVFIPETLRTRLVEAGQTIEALPGVGTRSGWWVVASVNEHEKVSLLSTTVTAWKGQDDWLEFDVDVWRTPGTPPAMEVEVMVGVACMCETNHNMHWVHSVSWAVDTPEAVANALHAAAEVFGRWFEDPGDANRWRTWAGLPTQP
jgi:hypothetical protein